MISIKKIITGAFRNKSIGRILFNERVELRCAGISGRVLDLAGGEHPGYLQLLPKSIELVRTNYAASPGVRAVDFNKPLPFADGEFDAVLLFNALYIAEDPEELSREIFRVLKRGGRWFFASPLISNEMPEPHDFLRFTSEGLARLCRRAGFRSTEIECVGERGSSAMTALLPFFPWRVLRAILYPIALLFDALVPARIRTLHAMPVLYFGVCTK